MSKYVIYGAGAIGGSLGAHLIKAGLDVIFIDSFKEHVDAVKSKGLYIEGVEGEFNVKAEAFLPTEYNEKLDVVFLAVKSQDTLEAIENISKLLADDGYVISLQNGINEYDIANLIGKERTIGAFVNWAADYISPGRIRYGGKGDFYIGELDGKISERLLHLQKALNNFLDVQITDNIMGYLWSKQVNICVMFTTGITPLSINEGLDYLDTQDVFINIAMEALQVPDKLGINLEEFDDFDPELYKNGQYKEALKKTADHYRYMLKNYTGLYRDLAIRKRKSEIDGTVGYVVKMGEQLGCVLPCNKKLVEMVHEIEDGNRKITLENVIELKKCTSLSMKDIIIRKLC